MNEFIYLVNKEIEFFNSYNIFYNITTKGKKIIIKKKKEYKFNKII